MTLEEVHKCVQNQCWQTHIILYCHRDQSALFLLVRLQICVLHLCKALTLTFQLPNTWCSSTCEPRPFVATENEKASEKTCFGSRHGYSLDDNYGRAGLIVASASSFPQCQHEALSKKMSSLFLSADKQAPSHQAHSERKEQGKKKT